MFVINISFIFILIIPVSRTSENKNVPLNEKLRRSVTHLKDILFAIEGKIKREKTKLSQIIYKLKRKLESPVARSDTTVQPSSDDLMSKDNYNIDTMETTLETPAPMFTFATLFPSPGEDNYWPPTEMTETSVITDFSVFAERTEVTTTTESEFIKDIKKTMEEDKHNYFTTFLTRFTELVAIKKPRDSMPVIKLVLTTLNEKVETIVIDDEVGKRLRESLKELLPMAIKSSPEKLREQAMNAHFTLKNKEKIMTPQYNDITDFYGKFFNETDGEELFKALDAFYQYNNGRHTAQEVNDMIWKAVLDPYMRVKDTFTTSAAINETTAVSKHVTTEMPTQYPVQSTQYPEEPVQYSENVNQYPVELTQYPENVNQYPLQPTQYPANVNQYPVQPTQYPENANQYPVQPTQYPENVNRYPVQPTQYPENINQYPVQPTQYPENVNQYPVQPTQYPQNINQYPVQPTQYPINANQYPTNQAQYPVNPNQYLVYPTQYSGQQTQNPAYSTEYPAHASTTTQNEVPSRRQNFKQNIRHFILKHPKLLEKLKHQYEHAQKNKRYHNYRNLSLDQTYRKSGDGKFGKRDQPSKRAYITSGGVKYYQGNNRNHMLHKIREVSSYSDEEDNLRNNLHDSLRHGNRTSASFRKSGGDIINKKILQELSSEPDEEWVLKNNIYKVFEQKQH